MRTIGATASSATWNSNVSLSCRVCVSPTHDDVPCLIKSSLTGQPRTRKLRHRCTLLVISTISSVVVASFYVTSFSLAGLCQVQWRFTFCEFCFPPIASFIALSNLLRCGYRRFYMSGRMIFYDTSTIINSIDFVILNFVIFVRITLLLARTSRGCLMFEIVELRISIRIIPLSLLGLTKSVDDGKIWSNEGT